MRGTKNLQISIYIVSFFSVVSHNGTKPSAWWGTPEKVLLRYGIQWKKNSCVSGYNRRKVV
jgi:hypothetical protein